MAEEPSAFRGRASSLNNVTNVIDVSPADSEPLQYKIPVTLAASADNVPRISTDPPITSRSDAGRQRSNTHMHLRPRKRSHELTKADSRLNLVFPFPMYESFIRDSISVRDDDKSLRSGGSAEYDEGSLDLSEEEDGEVVIEEDERFGEGIGSLGCVFSLWNTMVGSTIIVLPYGFHEAGPILGAFIAALAAGCSLFTAQMIARTGIGESDYGVVCGQALGPWAKHLAQIASLICWSGVFIVYQIMMTDSLVNLIQLFWSGMTEVYGAFIVAGVLFPICMLRDLTTIIQINAWGVVSVIFILLFMVVQSSKRWAEDNLASDNGVYDSGISQIISNDLEHPKFTGMGTLCGMLGAGYFSHNALLPIIRNKVDPSTNTRDCSIAYALVLISYLIAGLLPSLVFDNEMKQHDDQQNFLLLECFKHNGMAFAAQASLLLQLTTVWPLILGLIRSCIFETLTGSVWPSTTRVALLNVAYMVCSTLGTIVLHKIVGTVLSYIAAVSGIIYIYLLPCLMAYHEFRHNSDGGESIEDELLAGARGEHTKEKMEQLEDAQIVPAIHQNQAEDEPSGSRRGVLVLNTIVFVCGCSMLVMPFASKIVKSAFGNV